MLKEYGTKIHFPRRGCHSYPLLNPQTRSCSLAPVVSKASVFCQGPAAQVLLQLFGRETISFKGPDCFKHGPVIIHGSPTKLHETHLSYDLGPDLRPPCNLIKCKAEAAQKPLVSRCFQCESHKRDTSHLGLCRSLAGQKSQGKAWRQVQE